MSLNPKNIAFKLLPQCLREYLVFALDRVEKQLIKERC